MRGQAFLNRRTEQGCVLRIPTIGVLLAALFAAGCLGGSTDGSPDGGVADDAAKDLLVPEGCDAAIFPDVRGREVDVAVDPNDRSRVAAAAMVTPPSLENLDSPNDIALWTGLARSSDGGLTWETTILPYWPGDTMTPHPAFVGAAAFGDPILTFAPDGDLYFSGIILTGLMQYNMVSMRFPGDSLEATDITVFSRGAYGNQVLNDVPGVNPVAYNDKNDQAVDSETGGWYVSWMWRSNLQGMRTVPVVSYSEDGGQSWQGPVMLFDSVAAGVTADDANLAPAPFILGDNVFVAWSKTGAGSLWAASAPRGTLDFGEPYEIGSLGGAGGQGNSVLTLPMINVAVGPRPDGTGDRAWLTAIRGDDGFDVGVWYSDDGVTWEGPITPHANTTNDQMLPTITVAPDGRVAAQFIDRGDDPENVRYHTIASVSDDGGATWNDYRLSSVATNALHSGDSIQGHVGDYFGNAFTSAGLLGAWQDGRDGTQESPHSEIYGCVLLPAGTP